MKKMRHFGRWQSIQPLGTRIICEKLVDVRKKL